MGKITTLLVALMVAYSMAFTVKAGDSKRSKPTRVVCSSTPQPIHPLWVVDGVTCDSLFIENEIFYFVSPDGKKIKVGKEDIETFSILQQDSAKSLYGERAKDGVGIIRTKKGKKLNKK